jgi:acetolactate synthase-1/2/3 large subunit
MQLTGGEIVAKMLVGAGVPYAVGIPGHGCLQLVDALREQSDRLSILQPLHESAAIHLADGYYRATGQPLAAFTSIGPGALNTGIGLATAYVDSTAVLALTGEAHVHMFGVGVLQEIERRADAANWRALEPLCKRHFLALQARQLPRMMARAFNQMLTGRPGPVVIGLPMDVQAAVAEVELPDIGLRQARVAAAPDAEAIEEAADLLYAAKRPVILVGGGVITARACDELRRVAEAAGAAVVNTMMGLGAFPADHPLYGWATGSKGTSCGLQLTRAADVLLAVGCRFADETACSYRHGAAFAIPETKLIHMDLDPHEIGKNYPAEVGIVSDARAGLSALAQALESRTPGDWARSDYCAEIARLTAEWEQFLAGHRDDAREPVMISTMLRRIRAALPRDAIIVTSSGNTQAQMIQEFPFYEPGTCITTGGFSTMGFTLPAAIGVKLARPERAVVGVVGDGDFLMHIQELSTAVRYGVPVVIVVANNQGWISIRDLQTAALGEDHICATNFERNGEVYTPNLADVARDFGCWSRRVSRADEVADAINQARASERPAVVEVMVARDWPYTGTPAVGWWDVPIPGHLAGRREYEKAVGEEDV